MRFLYELFILLTFASGCRAVLTGTVELKVWDDANGDGIRQVGESGIEGIEVRLIHNRGLHTPYQTSPASGILVFENVPVGWVYADVKALPAGSVATHLSAGPEALDSDLKPTLQTNGFIVKAGEKHTGTDIGLKLPGTVKIFIWDDANANGIQEADEPGIPNLDVCLSAWQPGQQGTGAQCDVKEYRTSDAAGTVTFHDVPQGVRMNALLESLPTGSAVTLRDQGMDETIDSELRHDKMSEDFILSQGSSQVFERHDFGLKMPGVVEVFVWDDANANGIQDDGEVGLGGSEIRLLGRTGPEEVQGYKTVPASGKLRFTEVPQHLFMRLQLYILPDGRIPSPRNRGANEQLDSDLRPNLLSGWFRLNQGSAQVHTGTDIGLRLGTEADMPDLNPGIPCGEREDRQLICASMGDPHVNTFSNKKSHPMGCGEFVLARCGDFKVHSCHSPAGRQHVTRNDGFVVEGPQGRVYFTPAGNILFYDPLDTAFANPLTSLPGVSVNGNEVSFGSDHVFKGDARSMMTKFPQTCCGLTYGLCGAFNPSADPPFVDTFTSREGSWVDYGGDNKFGAFQDDFADSWAVTDATSIFPPGACPHECGEDPPCTEEISLPVAQDACEACIDDDLLFYDDCVEDVIRSCNFDYAEKCKNAKDDFDDEDDNTDLPDHDDSGPRTSPSPNDCDMDEGRVVYIDCPYESILLEHCYRCYQPPNLEVVVCDGWDEDQIREQCNSATPLR